MDETSRITDVEKIPAGENVIFTATSGADTVEGIVLWLGEEVVAYENYCQHWTDVRLDTGSGATLRDDELLCEKHSAYFELDTGYCTFGPCEGAVLEAIDVTVEDGSVYLTDESYTFESLGPAAKGDRSTGSRVGFTGN